MTHSRIKAQFETAMMDHLKKHMDPQIQKKISSTVLRELLSQLAEWAYVERNKWLVQFSESVRRRSTGEPEVSPNKDQALKERLKSDASSFLDALDEIR